jgi:MFS transporter, UMF1 family
MGEWNQTNSSMYSKSLWKLYFSLPILSWALYDFANTIFSSNIITIFFPFYLQEVLASNSKMNQIASTFISYTNSISSLLLVIFSPLYGVLIDRSGRKKRYIMAFTLVTIVATIFMGIFASWNTANTIFKLPLSIFLVLSLFVVAKFCYHSSLVFYDVMIADLGTKESLPYISGFGVAVGYIGTLVGLTVYPFVGEAGFHRAFIPTAILFLLFSLPLFLVFKEKEHQTVSQRIPFISGYREIMTTFKEMKTYKAIFLFMVTYFFINDAIATAVTMMAVYAKTITDFTAGQFIILYLVSTISSIVGSFAFGYVTKKIGAPRAVVVVSALLIIALCIAAASIYQFMIGIAGCLFGIALGAIWVVSRTLIVELTPPEKRGQFFGLFAFSGKVSSIVGPLLYGSITWLLSDYGDIASRVALGSLIVLVAIGLFIHRRLFAALNHQETTIAN